MTLRIDSDNFDGPVSVIGAGLTVSMGQNVIYMPVDDDDYDKLDKETLEAYDKPIIMVLLNALTRGSFQDNELLDAFGDVIEQDETHTVELDDLLDFVKQTISDDLQGK